MNGYPITLVGLENARCVVVGGGKVAARKVAALREAGARPMVISPVLCEQLECLAESGEIQAFRRAYLPGDLAGARLVIAATGDPSVNEAVWREAEAIGCLVNVVDDPEHCNFYVPATVRQGALTISVSTAGSSPLLARRIREVLEDQFDASYGSYLALLGELRPLVQESVGDPNQRKALWEALLNSEVQALLKDGMPHDARRRAMEIMASFH